MLDITNIPPPRVPVIDDRTGLMSREWYRFLLNLFRLSGSGSSDVTLTDLQLAPQSQVDFGDLNDSYDQAQLSYLSEQSNTLQGEIDSLKVCPTSNVESLVNELPLLSIVANNEQVIADLQNKIDTAPAIPQFGTIANYNFDNQAPLNGVLYSSTSIKTSPNLTFDGTNLGIGTAPSTSINVYSATNATILVQGDNSSTNIIGSRYANDANGANFIVRKYRGSVAIPATVASGDALGIFAFQGYGGTNVRTLAQVRAFVGTYTSDTNISAYLTLATSAPGSAASTERVRITETGNIYGTTGTTGMTNGFFYIPAAAGAPTGVPTAISGRVPMYYDTTNEKFYVYNGAWKSVLLT